MKGPFAVNRIGTWTEIPLDLTQPINTIVPLVQVPAAHSGVFPLEVIIVKERVGGVFATSPAIQIKAGNSTSSGIIVATTTITAVQGQSQTLQPPATSVPVATGGEDSYLFALISTAAVGQATASRARNNGVATIVFAASTTFQVGESVRFAGLGTGYDGVQEILSVSTTTLPNDTVTFLSAGANESTTADTDGSAGIFDARVFVNALAW